MKILIVEAYTAANIGSGALVENAVRLLQENFPGCSIEILAQSPESIEKLIGGCIINKFKVLVDKLPPPEVVASGSQITPCLRGRKYTSIGSTRTVLSSY